MRHGKFGKDSKGKPYTVELGANWVCCASHFEKDMLNIQHRFKARSQKAAPKIQSGLWYVVTWKPREQYSCSLGKEVSYQICLFQSIIHPDVHAEWSEGLCR